MATRTNSQPMPGTQPRRSPVNRCEDQAMRPNSLVSSATACSSAAQAVEASDHASDSAASASGCGSSESRSGGERNRHGRACPFLTSKLVGPGSSIFPLLADVAASSFHGGSPCKRLVTRVFQNRVEPPLYVQLQMGHPLQQACSGRETTVTEAVVSTLVTVLPDQGRWST